MKNLLIATVVTGAALAGLFLYLKNQTAGYKEIDDRDVTDAVGDAYGTNNNIGKTESKFDYALN